MSYRQRQMVVNQSIKTANDQIAKNLQTAALQAEKIKEIRRKKKEKQDKILNDKKNKASGSFGKEWSQINDEIDGYVSNFADADKQSNMRSNINDMVMAWGEEIDEFITQNPDASQAQINNILNTKIQKVQSLGNIMAHMSEARNEYNQSAGLSAGEEGAIIRDGKDVDLITVLDNFDASAIGEDANGNFYFATDIDGEDPTVINASNFVKDAEKGQAYFSKVKKFEPEVLKNQIAGLVEKDPRFYVDKGNKRYYKIDELREYLKTDPVAKNIYNSYLQSPNRYGQFQYLNPDAEEYSEDAYLTSITDAALATLPTSIETKRTGSKEKPRKNYSSWIQENLYVTETDDEGNPKKDAKGKVIRNAKSADEARKLIASQLISLNPDRYYRGSSDAVKQGASGKIDPNALYEVDQYGRATMVDLSDEKILNNPAAVNRILVQGTGASTLASNF